MQHFTGVGVRVERGGERNDASKAPRSHVSVEMGVIAKRSSLWVVSHVGGGWWDQGTVLGPVDGNGGAGRLRGKKHTSAPLPCLRGGENMATEFAKLVLFPLVKSLLPFLITWVEHWGEVLTFRGCYRPWARVFPLAMSVLVQSPRHAVG